MRVENHVKPLQVSTDHSVSLLVGFVTATIGARKRRLGAAKIGKLTKCPGIIRIFRSRIRSGPPIPVVPVRLYKVRDLLVPS